MKTLYIECRMGVAGDMLTAALLDLLPEEKRYEALKALQAAAPHGVKISCKSVEKCGIRGNYVSVLIDGCTEETVCEHHHEHHHEYHKMSDIVEIVGKMNIADKVKKDVIKVYNLLARAESHAHGKNVEEIHFHEVGNKDAIMDITSVCYLMNLIGADSVFASPINVGSGFVHCAHGTLPVPAPATEYLLRGIPYYEGNIDSELCTPTGAALLKYYVKSFCSRPMMSISKTGIGCGKKDFETANCVRVFMGNVLNSTNGFSEYAEQEVSDKDKVFQLDANVDDMTGEEIGFAIGRLFEAGAREVFTTAIYMKKNRPGSLISVICSNNKKNEIVKAFFKHTTTIGIRQKECQRYILERDIKTVKTSAGEIRKKISQGYEIKRSKLEFDDVEKIALENNISFREAKKMLEKESGDCCSN